MWINSNGDLYEGDCVVGDREATDDEVAAWEAERSKPDYAAEIDSLERQALMPRATREFMLQMYSTTAAGQGISTPQLIDPNDTHYSPGFAKLSALDLQIKQLRARL